MIKTNLALGLFYFSIPLTGLSGVLAQERAPMLGAGPDIGLEGVASDVLSAQILLDRAGHSPGVIDGQSGGNTSRAIKAFQLAHDMEADGKLSTALLQILRDAHPEPLLRRYALTAEDIAGPFVTVPQEMTEQAKLDALGYSSVQEKLAERFHMSETLLTSLNKDADFAKAGTEIVVAVAGSSKLEEAVTRIEVDKKASAVRAFSGSGQLLATFPATIGSGQFPSPSGAMEVLAVAPKATYHFSPEGRSWGPDKALTIAAGPNNPVGGIWIDLSKEGYGIHGTPDPSLIGKTASHGCVRLTNWDAASLAAAVSKGTKVEFL